MKNIRKFEILDSGEIWTEDEIREHFEMFRYESDLMSEYETFEDYMDDQISLGRSGQGGIVEVE